MACIIVGFLFRFWKYNDKEHSYQKSTYSSNKSNATFSNLGEILSSSIINSIHTVIMIGGFVVLFCVIISILNNSCLLQLLSLIFYPIFNSLNIDVSFIKPILSGLVELTNGINLLSHITTKSISISITFVAFLLGFGGISVLLQVLSITSKSDISIKPYFIRKIIARYYRKFFNLYCYSHFPTI